MTTFLLIRHGLTDAVGHHITGRLPGVFLNETGRRQAERLPDRLARWRPTALYSSPLERTLETSEPIAQRFSLTVNQEPGLAEFDFGQWSGLSIAELDQRHDWQMFCRFRSSVRAPDGELITETQTRMVTALTSIAARHPDQCVAIVSHADAIRATIMHFLPIPLDHIHRIAIDPASISVLKLYDWGVQISALNLTE